MINDKLVEALVTAYRAQRSQFELFRDQLLPAITSSSKLAAHVHSIKSRIKDPEHLRDKLRRKIAAAKTQGIKLELTVDNFPLAINDLVGVRILHLYTQQIREIDLALREVLAESRFELVEGPSARTWDDESRDFFSNCGIKTLASPSMYTSVHYVIGSASRTKMTAEIQVRTLMEEVWGEVDHTLNYPHLSQSLACREQLKVLARVTSSASRLVNSIFATHADYEANTTGRKGAKSRSKRKQPRRQTSKI